MPVLRGLTVNTPKRRSSMRSPRPSAFFMASKTVSTACSALVRVMLVFCTMALTISSFIMRTPGTAEPHARQGFAGCQAPRCVIRCATRETPPRRAFSHREDRRSVKSDKGLRKMSLEHKMIEPCEDRQVRGRVISYGVSSYGYGLRVADEF